MSSKHTLQDSITESPLHNEYLQVELARIDLLLQREVQRWKAAGQDPADQFRGLYVSDNQIEALQGRPFASSWSQALPPTADMGETQALADLNQKSRQILETSKQNGFMPRLAHLAHEFNLDPFEQDLLLICLAPALDLRYERIFAYLQDDITRKRPGINLALDLLSQPGVLRYNDWHYFNEDAPLFKYFILEKANDTPSSSLLNQSLVVDNSLVSWLMGSYQPRSELMKDLKLIFPADNPLDMLFAGESLNFDEDQTLIFFGTDVHGQEAAARVTALYKKRPLISLTLAEIPESINQLKAIRLTLRDARLTQAIPFFRSWDLNLDGEGRLPVAIQNALADFPGLVITSGKTHWQVDNRSVQWIPFDFPIFAQRRKLWQHFLDLPSEPDKEITQALDEAAGQFFLTSYQIYQAAVLAKQTGLHNQQPLSRSSILTAARGQLRPGLERLAARISPRYDWKDLILPEDPLIALREIVSTVRNRPTVLEDWGVGKKLSPSGGVTILFAGQPGTGKTMSAEIIAGELGLDLYKIDLSQVVSKYIGETEKNLRQVFDAAQEGGAILFFDEADALFGKRSEVKDSHDRYANIEISYLLQCMENYAGVTILATNLRSNLDEAFTRRLQFVITFPFPEETERLRIWKTLFPPQTPCSSEIDFEQLARRFKLAGGNIRNIIINAAYLAAANGKKVGMPHLLHSTFRELQKMGRLVKEEDLNQV